MSHHQYWQLDRLPFGRVRRREDFYEGVGQREALARFGFLANNARAVGVLIGGPGTGKSTVIDFLRRHMIWGDSTVDVIALGGRIDGVTDCIREWAHLVGAPQSLSRSQTWRYLCDSIDASSRQGVRSFLLIDDASEDACHALSALINRSHNIVAAVTTDYDSAGPIVHAVGGCPLRIDLPSWTLEDTAGYLCQSVAASGGRNEIFSDAAIVRLHELGEGRVATIARLAELSLLAGAGSQASFITPELVEAIQEEMLVAA